MQDRVTLGYLKIDTKLPSLNEVNGANRTNPYAGAKLKKQVERDISSFIAIAKARGTLRHVDEPVVVFVRWHEQNRKRDVDNVESSIKFILDSLVKNGILDNDSPKWLKQQYPKVIYDTKATYSEVWLARYDKERD